VLRRRSGAPLLASALDLAVDDVPLQIQELERLELVACGLREQVEERALRDGAPAQAGDDGVAVQVQAGKRFAHTAGDDAADARREALLEHDDALRVF